MVKQIKRTDNCVIELRPNRSATWQECKLFMWLMGSVVMIIALAWWFVGAWLILPFAGFEAGLFVWLLYRVSKSSYQYQLIAIGQQDVTIIDSESQQSWTLLNGDVIIKQDETEKDWQLPALYICSHSETVLQIEIGAFLNLADKRALFEVLKQHYPRVIRTHWWKT